MAGDRQNKARDRPGRVASLHGSAGHRLGRAGDWPQRSGDRPEKAGDRPEKAGDRPGRAQACPERKELHPHRAGLHAAYEDRRGGGSRCRRKEEDFHGRAVDRRGTANDRHFRKSARRDLRHGEDRGRHGAAAPAQQFPTQEGYNPWHRDRLLQSGCQNTASANGAKTRTVARAEGGGAGRQ